MGDYYDATAPLSLMGYVHPDKEIAAEGSACKERAGVSSSPGPRGPLPAQGPGARV